MSEYYRNTSGHTHPETEIPEALRREARWMGTRFEPRKGQPGKLDKPPYRVVSGLPYIKEDKTDPSNWTTYEQALSVYERGKVDAIGFVFTESDPFYVVDQDGVVDPETGEIDQTAAEIVHTQDTYTELSCSGTGLHTIGRGTKQEYAGCRSQALGFEVEVYDRARFLVMTGRRIGSAAEPLERQKALDALCSKLWPKRERFHSGQRFAGGVDVADSDLLDRARRSRSGAKFRKLYDHGEISDYPSHSEADYSLLNMLIFWTAGDHDQIVRLFEASALYRQKDKGRSYVSDSTREALASYRGSFYQPRRVDKARTEDRDEDPLTPYLKLLLDPSAWTGRKGASAYKTYAAAVIRASEDGIVDDHGNLRIGCDTRTLAEIAGTRRATIRESSLPYLVQEKKLLSWQPGKGRRAGTFVLLKPDEQNRPNKETTHFNGTVSHTPEAAAQALKTLRLLIRMRCGRSNSAALLRLGMPAMFVAIALASGAFPRRGQNIEELQGRTGRSKSDLRRALKRLKAASIAREPREDVYRLTDDFAAQYERVLDQSGITYAERQQRWRHEEDRRRRDANIPTDEDTGPLLGKERNERNLEERAREDRERWFEEQRTKVGMTTSVFLADEIDGEYGVRFSEALDRWRVLHGGEAADLWRAIHHGPFMTRRLAGDLYVYHEADPDEGVA